jgi:purine nucleoside phosphorylase
MRVGIITGSGMYALRGLETGGAGEVQTRWGPVRVTRGTLAGTEIVHVSRHGEGHVRLSNHVTHRANIAALRDAGCDAVLAVTVCGGVDPDVPLGSLVVFDDLYFPSNRLPDGSLCTFHDRPGDDARAHWIYEHPFSEAARRALVAGAREAGVQVRDGGCYGHVDGPRFNTRAEIRALAACGVTAISQTAAAEVVLCGEAELPFGLIGYVTDYANGVAEQPTPVETFLELVAASPDAFARVLAAALPALDAGALAPVGVNQPFHAR